jgi:predicted DNA-binding transcriptional regulator YafY
MSRAERLLELMQVLRGYKRPVTSAKLANKLGISVRTLYRDVASLQAQGADIQGEPGLGYVLKPGYTLPPLMFTHDQPPMMRVSISPLVFHCLVYVVQLTKKPKFA